MRVAFQLILSTVVGTQTAYAWVRCGHRTLDDLRAVESTLTRCQRIGLKYYDELLDRMPRTEAAEIEAMVLAANADRNKKCRFSQEGRLYCRSPLQISGKVARCVVRAY